jgi:hypothetical protein
LQNFFKNFVCIFAAAAFCVPCLGIVAFEAVVGAALSEDGISVAVSVHDGIVNETGNA